MKTLFECWNAGVVEWDGLSAPKLSFAFPIASNEMLAFFLVSARINQLLSKLDWQLSFAGQVYPVPPFPSHEMCRVLSQLPIQFGYGPMLQLSRPGAHQGEECALSQLQWVHMASGKIYSFAPFVGVRCSKSHARKHKALVVASSDALQVDFNAWGLLTGTGDMGLMERLPVCSSLGYQTACMLKQYFKSQQNSAQAP